MRATKLYLKNFRAYRDSVEISLDDLTVLIGRNDVGKSSILEALDIFFNDKKGTVKLEKDDLNLQASKDGETELVIGVSFSDLPSELIVDSTVKSSLGAEYLLDENEELTVRKTYRNGSLSGTTIEAHHPINDDTLRDLLLLKKADLANIVKTKGLRCTDKRKSSELRKSIRDSYSDLRFENVSIPVDKEGAKQIWEPLQNYMPVYALFQSDRTNKDNDTNVQDPLKLAVQEILKKSEIQIKLKEVAREVNEVSARVAGATLEKLKELNPEIASQLKPEIPEASELKWHDVFKNISISSDEGIPLNKRGSGVRRLVLISFFGAEAERRMTERGVPNVIYAIEEPETSQHPDHQKYLIDSLEKLSETENAQVLITTHHPSTAQLVPTRSIRLVDRESSDQLCVESGEKILSNVAETLGVLPSIGKLAICVEGENDRHFLQNIGKISELKQIVDLGHKQIALIPMQGGNLKLWVDRNYLDGSNMLEYHLYDRDDDLKYESEIESVNNRPGRSKGRLTKFREIENYVHKDILATEPMFGQMDFSSLSEPWCEVDLPKEIANATQLKESTVKRIVCKDLAQGVTKTKLEELGAWDEVEEWFREIAELFHSAVENQDVGSS